MEKEKIDEYNRNVENMIESYYGLGKVVMGRTGLDDKTIMSLMSLDLLAFLLYLCENGKPNDEEIRYIQKYTEVDMPPEYWSQMMTDLNINVLSMNIPQTFDMFIEFDNQLFRQGEKRACSYLFLSIYQAVGVGIEGADGIIREEDLDKLKEYISRLKMYYAEKYIGNIPLEVDPINPEVITILSSSGNNGQRELFETQDIVKKAAHYYDVRFMGKTYKVPEDAVTFIKSREFVGKELIKLINEASDMIVRYSDTEAPKFFENFNSEINRYHTIMLEACQDIIDDFISRDIYDVSATDFADRLSGFKDVQELGNKVVIKATNAIQKLVDTKKAGVDAAYRSAASTITGSGLHLFTSSFASLMVYSAVEKQIMLLQAKKADQRYEKAVKKIQEASKDALNQICTSILINDFGMGLVDIIEKFNNELMQNYLLELTMHGQFDVDNIEGYSENRSNAILENLSKVSDKKKLLIQAYEASPFNIDVYEKMLEVGYFDVDTFKDAKQIFPVETLQEMVELYLNKTTVPIEKMDAYVAVLADYLNTDEGTIVKKYFSKSGKNLVIPFENIRKICGDIHKFDRWIRDNISSDMDQISELSIEGAHGIAEKWISHQVDDEKVQKLFIAGVNPFDTILQDDDGTSDYYNIKKKYVDLLAKSLGDYISEAKKRRKIYEEAYQKYNVEFDKQREKIEELQRCLAKIGLFSFSKKREIKEKIAMEQAKLNGIAEPIEQKNAYYNMYK